MQSPNRQIKNANPNRKTPNIIAKSPIFFDFKTKKAPIFSGVFFIDFDLLTFAKPYTSSVELHLLG